MQVKGLQSWKICCRKKNDVGKFMKLNKRGFSVVVLKLIFILLSRIVLA